MPDMTMDKGPGDGDAIPRVPTSIAAFAGRTPQGRPGVPVPVTSLVDFKRHFGAISPEYPLTLAVRACFENGGNSAVILKLINEDGRADDRLDPATFAGDGVSTGLHALRRAEFNLLSIPPDAPDTDTRPGVWATAAGVCTECRAVLLIDAPARLAGRPDAGVAMIVSGIDALRAALDGTHLYDAAVYSPRLLRRTTDTWPEAPCGAVAGVIARADRLRGVWQAPGGIEAAIAGIQGLSVTLNDRDLAQLGALGINCLRWLPGTGPVLWGARTLADPRARHEFTYLSVRRLALLIETSVDRGTAWAALEPNAEPAWARIRASVEAFMFGLYHDGAFAGSTPATAYDVKCGRDTTTQADIDAGIVNIDIGFAPLKPAEFVIVHLRRMMMAP